MPRKTIHRFASGIGDSGDTTLVRPSDWGEVHVVGDEFTNRTGGTLAAGDVVGTDLSNNNSVILQDGTGAATPLYVTIGKVSGRSVVSLNALDVGYFTNQGVHTTKVTGAVTRRNYLRKSATTLALEDTGVPALTRSTPAGVCAVAMSSAAGPGLGTVDALWLGHTTGLENITPNWRNVRSYGAQGDGSTDDTAAIQAAIDSLPNDGGVVYLPTGQYKITSTLFVGNGTSGAESTKHNIVLRGAPNSRPISSFTKDGTALLWYGASSGVMLQVRGPILGAGLENLTFEGRSLAGYAVIFTHPNSGTFKNLHAIGCTLWGFDLQAYNTHTWAQGDGANRNRFERIQVSIIDNGASGVNIGQAAASVGNLDPAQNSFNDLIIRADGVLGTSTVGLQLRFADFNTFNNVLAWCDQSLKLIVPTGTASMFPNSNWFFNCSFNNGVTQVGTWTGTHPNGFVGWHTGDGEPVPDSSKTATMGVTSTGRLWGAFGTTREW